MQKKIIALAVESLFDSSPWIYASHSGLTIWGDLYWGNGLL